MINTNRTVLVIDDDPVIREIITFHLEKQNFHTLTADSAALGFKALNENRIDLVLCDIIMEDMDGLEFCKKVREKAEYRPLPFIFVTAKDSIEDRIEAVEAGGDDVITKPFDVIELILKIQTLIKRSDIYKSYGIKKEIASAFDDSTQNILLIDDDPTITKIFNHSLHKAGFNCITAHSAVEGFELAKSCNPDLIISDILMPDTDGYAFRKMLNEDDNLKSIPFVFLTSKEGEDDILDGYNYGVTDYIVKTSGEKVITAKVKAIIDSLTKERKKLIREINYAADALRVKVVAENSPEIKNIKITQWHIPFKGIPGGDFLDYVQLSDSKVAVILGDVMGKKWGAWYFAFAYAAYVRSNLRSIIDKKENPSPAEVLKQVNKTVYDDASVSEIFAAISLLIIDSQEKTIKYSGAGDIPLFLKSGKNIKKIYSEGVFLGLTSEGSYQDTIIKPAEGDMMFLLTDGILETRNSAGEQYGKRLQELLRILPDGEDSIDLIKEDFNKFSEGKTEDDISIVAVKMY
jgi:phosphoserine phosphatase RsbU/P